MGPDDALNILGGTFRDMPSIGILHELQSRQSIAVTDNLRRRKTKIILEVLPIKLIAARIALASHKANKECGVY